MSDPDGQPGAEVVPIRPGIVADTSYEVELDEPPLTGSVVPVDPPVAVATLLPVIPDQWKRQNIPATLRRYRAKAWHETRFHGFRLHVYLLLTVRWSVAGLFKLMGRQIAWWWVAEQHDLRRTAAKGGDERAWRALHREAKQTRKFRGYVLLAEAVALTAGVLALTFAPWWAIALAVAVALPLLARFGHPPDRRIISQAVVEPRFRRLSADIVLRAYYAAGLGHPDKPDQQVTFGSPMARDGEGSRVLVDLPYGRGLDDAVKARSAIASGLDVTESQVFIHRDPTSHRRHVLWVADRDPLAVPVGRTPLLACKATDIWKPAPLGLDERGQLVRLLLMWTSVLVGALPRQGKSWTARLLGLYCALDPFVRLDVFDAGGKPDWRKFRLIADSCAFGLTPTKDGVPAEILLSTLEKIKADVQDRYNRLSELPTSVCPEGKLTRQIARDPRYGMPVRVLFLDEFQEYYDLGDISRPIAEGLRFLVKVAPAAGVIPVWATQKPAGIGGTGNLSTMFNATRDNFTARFALRTASYTVSEAVLGQGTFSMGLDSSALLPQYKGVGILHGASDQSPTVRCHKADDEDAEKILLAARALRERAGTLSGMALGETPPEQVSILADVLAVLGQQPALHWQTLAALLRQRYPERHADSTAESVRAQCGSAGVPSVDVKHLGRSRMGCRREHVEAAIRARQP